MFWFEVTCPPSDGQSSWTPISWLCVVLIYPCFVKQLATQGILQYALRGMLGDPQHQSLFMVCRRLRKLLCSIMWRAQITTLQPQWSNALARIEKDYPLGMQVSYFSKTSKCINAMGRGSRLVRLIRPHNQFGHLNLSESIRPHQIFMSIII